MLRGPATHNMYVADMPAAIAWYTELLGAEPYYLFPQDGPTAYAEWRVGDRETEIGLIDAAWAPHPVGTPAGSVLHWAVDDLQGSLDRLIELGATAHEPVTERGPGFVTASVVDPFGNLLGIMTNVHYLEMLRSEDT